jgi:hypothetical protein
MSMVKRTVRRVFITLAALALSACGRDSCAPDHALDKLFGGGLPVCLGGSYAQLEQYSDRALPDSVSSQPSFRVQIDDATYSYEPAGGIDLLVARPFAKLGRACRITPEATDAELVSLARHGMAVSGGSWQESAAPNDVRRWVRPDRLTVGIWSRWSTVCISLSPP